MPQTQEVRRPQILQVFSRYLEYGGEEGSVFRIGDALQEECDVEYFLGSTEDLLQRDFHNRVLAPFRAYHNLPVSRRLRRYQEVGRFDFWLVHNVLPGLSPSIYKTAFSLGVPLVHYLHNYRLGCTNGFFINHGSPCQRCIQGNFWPAFATACWKDSRWISGYMGMILGRIRKLGLFSKTVAWIAISAAQKKKHVEMGIPADRIHVVHHFYETQAPPPIPSPHGDYLFLGRLSTEKGVDRLLRAWAQVHNRGPKLIIAGTGPDEIRLRNLAAELRIRNVVFTGHVNKDQQAALWAKTAALVVPSIWAEPFGMVVLEAWAHARPVVAFASGALPEIIHHESDGLLAESCSEVSLAAKMTQLMESPSWGPDLGRAGFLRLQNDFSRESWLKKIRVVFNLVLNRG